MHQQHNDHKHQHAMQGNVTHHNSSSSWAVVHKSQLAKSSFTAVSEQQLLVVAVNFGGLELAALYDIEIVSFLTFPAWCFHCKWCRTLGKLVVLVSLYHGSNTVFDASNIACHHADKARCLSSDMTSTQVIDTTEDPANHT